MLIDANLRNYFWPFAVLAAVHIKQCVPHTSLPPHTTPSELWFRCRAELSHLCPFGLRCTTRVISNNLTKFEARGESGRFLGYARDAKGYLIWVTNPNNNAGTLKVQRDVIFHDFTNPTPSPNIPSHYLLLWEHVNFPNRLITSDDEQTKTNGETNITPYVHTWCNTSLRRLNRKLHL
jgi:hypothetical protein